MAPAGLKFDGSGGVAEAHPPELYSPAAIAATLPTLAEVGPAELEAYEQRGWLAVERVLEPMEIAEARRGIEDLVAGRSRGFDGVFYEDAAREQLEASPSERGVDKVRKLASFVEHDARLRIVAENPALRAVVGRLLGSAVPRLFQDMALLKPPHVGREKPWHQDHAYFDLPLGTRVVGVWIALDDATVENGCMQVLDGGHKLGPVLHWRRRDWQICDSEMLGRRSLACPLPAGGALFFDSFLPHGTPTNLSGARRRALQFHYCPADAHPVSEDERLRVFGTEGKGLTC